MTREHRTCLVLCPAFLCIKNYIYVLFLLLEQIACSMKAVKKKKTVVFIFSAEIDGVATVLRL